MEAKAKVTRNYQVTIPLEVRSRLGIEVGSYVRFVVDEKTGRVYLEKAASRRKRLRLGLKLTPEEIEKIMERGMRECMK
ncbi:MAG: AbrB family transcriptional regulator [Thermoproteota archaeon]|nr:MAG: AbrB family transcriptional regulator [Candidatus Korarchaeota archaeon]RLG55874.1 MAG: AbrB family transcriptional regulator [Candidatus Korarchaeota archaeon]